MDGIERRESHTMLEKLSFEDTLTEVFNRNKFNHDVENLKVLKLDNVGIAYFDINGLKLINDTKGHVEGDRIIKAAAKTIKDVFPNKTYRIGGDEFVVVDESFNEAQFNSHVENVLRGFSENGISVSVGVSWAGNTEHIEEYLTSADNRM